MLPAEFTHKSTDGAMWVLEGAVEEKYQVTLRPGDIYPKYTNCLMHLVNLTDLNTKESHLLMSIVPDWREIKRKNCCYK
ncbi:hypothetical protein [Agriterribacter humi]|uniref:hypothetical protein n=1 Tax=Agriterribacter humi TaxID=1104781 RepID=UPI001264FCF4|nr:hypothetical protein [Agriterribacter humi]